MSTQYDITRLKSLCKTKGISFSQDVREIARRLQGEYALRYGQNIAHTVSSQVRASGVSDTDYALEFYRQLSVASYEVMVISICKALDKQGDENGRT
jgi:hypothetical protein